MIILLGGCPLEESAYSCLDYVVISSLLQFYPFVGPFYSLFVPAYFDSLIRFCNIYCLSHRRVGM
jgi:hypothetical protein